MNNHSITNTYLCNRQLNSQLASELGNSGGFFRFQFLLDLIPLLDELLPHEFEKTLGDLFSLSQTTFIFIPDEREKGVSSHSHFFEYWKGFKEMINNACSKAGLPEPQINYLAQHRVYRVDMINSFSKRLPTCSVANSTDCIEGDDLSFFFDGKKISNAKQGPLISIKGKT